MKAKLFLFVFGTLVFLCSCNKEIIPDNEMIVGTWIAKDVSIEAGVEFTIREMTLIKSSQSNTQFYSIRNNSLYRYPDKIYDPDNFSTHAIYLNEKKNELRIRGLGGSISEADGFAIFVRQ